MIKRALISLAILIIVITFQACDGSEKYTKTLEASASAPQVLDDGNEIVFPGSKLDLPQFRIDTVHETTMKLSISAPVYNLVRVIKSDIISKKLYLFENQDITDLYSNYLTSDATMEHSSLALQRVKNLFAHGIAAAKDMQDAEQDYASTQTSLADNISKLTAAGINPRALKHAPAGTVWAIADIDEEQVSEIKPYSRVDLEYDAYQGEHFTGVIFSVGEVVDPVTRKVKVRISIINPEGKLHPGMFGTARFLDGSMNVIAVPSTSVIQEDNGAMSVWVTSDYRHFIKRQVRIGQQSNNEDQILDGLKPGELVVAKGGIFLSNMNQVDPTD